MSEPNHSDAKESGRLERLRLMLEQAEESIRAAHTERNRIERLYRRAQLDSMADPEWEPRGADMRRVVVPGGWIYQHIGQPDAIQFVRDSGVRSIRVRQ